jgi:hypothetical protein
VNHSVFATVRRASALDENDIQYCSEIMIVSCDGVDGDGHHADGDNGKNTRLSE